jgi:uncharacterized damage-inducible protein DinB
MPLNSLLEEAIEAWEDTRNGVIDELENFPPGQFDLRPAANVRTVAELALHIMEASLMMVGELTREDGNFRRAPFPKLIAEYSKPIAGLTTRRQIMPALRRTLKEGVKAFRDAGELHMLQTIVRFDGQQGTRLAWMNHGIAHEMYHRGQFALYARLIGLEPALTRRIHGRS